MKVKITEGKTGEKYEIQLLQITQLCGTDFRKKNFILTSLQKYFSNTRYAEYELSDQENIEIEGEKVGRKYFSLYSVRERNDLIRMIRLGRSTLMMDYLSDLLQEFEYQRELDGIGEHLERIYLDLNKELGESIANIEIGYEQKKLWEIIQASQITGRQEEALECLSNQQLLETYFDLLFQRQKRKPEKSLIIVENIDHMLTYPEYLSLIAKADLLCKEYDLWFVFSTSIEGFAALEREWISGVNIVNDIIYLLPDQEEIVAFVKNHYPCEKELKTEAVMEGLRSNIQNIGKEGYDLNLTGLVVLRLINGTLCINNYAKEGINRIENSFLISKNMV